MDKINRKSLQKCTQGRLRYGRGEVTFEGNGEVAGFEIDYTGGIKGINKLDEGWIIKIGRKKIIIISLSEKPLSELLFTYIGSLKIINCVFVNWDEEIYTAKVKNLNTGEWNRNTGQWGSDARKPEEIENYSVIKKRIKKSVI